MFHRIIASLLLAIFFQTAWAAKLSESEFVKQTMEQFLKSTQAPGAAVAIVRNGKTQIYVFGNADLKTKTPVTPQTIFEVGSFTKLFTAILLAEDVNQHKLQLTDNISQRMPEFESNWIMRRITLEQLATHTSGFPFQVPKTVKTPAELHQYLLKWKGDTSATPTWVYSNVGIGLLGKIVAEQAHQTINQLYLERILLPLHMSPIGITVPANLQSLYAQGYSADGKPAPHLQTETTLFPAAGHMKMSIDDLSKFLNASIGVPGTPQILQQAIQFSQIPRVKVGDMLQALGWQVRPFRHKNALLADPNVLMLTPTPYELLPRKAQQFDPTALIEKTGGTDGFRAYIALIPKSKSGVVVIANRFVDHSAIVYAGRKLLLN